MFYLQISNNKNSNDNKVDTLRYDTFRDFISNENKSKKWNWVIDWLTTDDTTSDTWQQFIGKSLHELLGFCRRILHKEIETRKCMLSDEHMKLFSHALSNGIKRYNYNEEDVIKHYSCAGAGLCEFRPNKFAGYSFLGNKAKLQFTDENINLITYELNRKKLLKSAIKYLKTQAEKEELPATSTSKLVSEINLVMTEIHTDLDNRQIPGQLNIFDYVGIA